MHLGIPSCDVCCPKSCGRWGGSGCGSFPGGATKCCTSGVRNSGKVCWDVYDTACIQESTADLVLANEPSMSSRSRASGGTSRSPRLASTVEDEVGGHLIVFHTSVPQMTNGVRIENFGQGGVLGRYPIHFHKCGSSAGSVVARNVMANSKAVCLHSRHRQRPR